MRVYVMAGAAEPTGTVHFLLSTTTIQICSKKFFWAGFAHMLCGFSSL